MDKGERLHNEEVLQAEETLRLSAGPNECIVFLNLSEYEASVLMGATHSEDQNTLDALQDRVNDQLRADWRR